MKKIILSFVFLAFAFTASAQVFSALKQLGITDGNVYDEGQGVVVDASGNTYITGRFNGTLNFGGTSFTSNAVTAVYIAKYNSAGALQWVKKIDGQTYGEYTFRSNIALDATGNVYLYANFYSSGTVDFTGGTTLTLTNDGGLIAKYNSSGVLQWANAGGEVYNITVDAAGNAYTTGQFGGSPTFNGQSGSSISVSGAGGYSGFVAKYNTNGVIQWVNTMVGGGGTVVRGQGIATDASGNIVTTGIFLGSGAINFSGTNLSVIGNNDIFLLKYNSAGTLQWIKQISGAGSVNSGNGVATDASGNVILTGSFQGSTNFGGTTLTASGASDSFIGKYNSAGLLQWVKQGFAITGQTNYGANVITDAVGNSYTIGNFRNQITFSGTTLNITNANTFYLVKYNNAGTFQWLNKVGGNSGESDIYGNDIAVDANVNIYTLGQGNAGSTYNFFGTNSVVGNFNNIFLLTLNGCTGTLPPTNTTNVTICNNTSTTLSATCAAEDVVWYNSSSIAIPFTGTSYTTPNLTANTTYKVRCENGLCQSAFTDIVVTVKPPLFAPTAPSQTICYNTTASLTATCVNGSPVWYNASSVAIPFTGSPYVTPTLTTNTTYKVRCESGGTPNCLGSFTDVVVTVFPNVVAPTGTANQTICYNTTASLSATCQSGTTPNWYNASSVLQYTGSTFVTPNLTANTTYRVRCEKGGTPNCMGPFGMDVVVTVFPNITAPTAPSQTICNNTTASLSATCQSGTTPNWYNSGSVAIPFTGSPYVTPTLTTNTTYKVRCESGGTPNCVGLFTDVVVTVFPNVVAPTGTANQTICYNTTASLSATCQSGTTPNWYNASSVLQYTGSLFVTPSLTVNTTYKVRCEKGGTPNCMGPFGMDVVVTVFPNITAPTAPSQTICYNTTASLSATCQSGTTPNWYNSSSVAIPFTGSPYVTPTLTTNTTYKVRCESGGTPNCVGSFTDVVVTVFPNITSPTAPSQTICNNTTASLSATCQSGTTPNWYNSGSVAIPFTGSPYVTPTLTTNTTYKVRCESGGTPNCVGLFTDVEVTVFPNVVAPTGTANQTICYNTTAALSATCQSGTTPNWYNASSVAIPFTGSPYVTPTLITNTTYKVRCESGGTPNCLGSFTDVVVTVNPNVNAPMANGVIINQNTSTSLSATCTSSTAKWYNINTGGTLLGTGSYTTPILSNTTTYYVACETGGTPNCVSSRTPQTVTVNQPSFDSATSGNWNVATTWTCNCIPNGTLLVRIVGNHIVTVPTAYTGQAKGLQFTSTGKVILQGTGKVNLSN